ncbi:MAG TPA: periplasmic heavy metal sensor [Steroidobacteraceae bacterium]|nr:periplasmic heavy metal sensor [Steroidobacteraceae bacterium]
MSPSAPASSSPSLLRRLLNRYTLVSFAAGAALAVGIGASALSGAMGGMHGMMIGNVSPAEVQTHVDHMLKHLYVELDATEAQKAQIGPLVQQAVSDLLPLHSQIGAAHTQALQALQATPVDRTALEAARAAHLQLADQASKRFVQLIADVGDTLTPVQRKAFLDHINKMHAMPHS